MATRGIERFLEAIGYPDRPDANASGASAFTLRVDGAEALVEEIGGRIVLSMDLGAADASLPTLARYASGRILKENAALSWDAKRGAFIWQDESADADANSLLRLFETFMDSCDWWRERVGVGESHPQTESVPESMVIRP